MAVSPTYPGVYIRELPSAVHPITGVATSIAAFVGYTARGIDNRAEHIYSFADYERLFGGISADSELSYAVQQFFANGGTEAYVVRVPRASAGYANVVFGGLTFTALSSGAWADGKLLIDVDTNGLSQALANPVTVTSATPAITVTGTGFQTALSANQWLIFGNDTTATPYQIQSVDSDTSLTLKGTGYVGTGAGTATTAIVTSDPLAFNLTVTNLVDSSVENFPNVTLNSNQNNFVLNVVNDPDNGSQLVSVLGSPSTLPSVSGIVGTPLTIATVNTALGSANKPFASVAVQQNSSTVTGTGFTSDLVGKWVTFASDATQTLYQITAVDIVGGQTLTLGSKFAGQSNTNTAVTVSNTTAKGDYTLTLNVKSPPTISPLPITITVFSNNSPLPQTVAGLAAQLQRAINTALAVQLPGATVQCSVSGTGSTQAIRVNASLPHVPDAVITLQDSSSNALGLNSGTNLPPVQSVAHYALGTGNGTVNSWGGNLTSSAIGSDGNGPSATNDLIGDPGKFTGIYALEKVDIFNLLCIPEATRATPGNASVLDSTVDPNAIYSAAMALCGSRRAFLLLDSPPFVNTVSAAVDWMTNGLTVSAANGAVFFPRLRLPDPLNNYQLRTFAPCGVVAGLYARIDASRGVWKAPAGTEATLSGVQSLVYKLSDAENGTLNPLGLNCFRTFPVYKTVLWGARTLLGADALANQWKYVPVRRVALFLEESLYRGTQWVVFEPNDEPLWSAIRLNVGSFMQELFRQGYFQGQTPSEAYFVKCDSETTTQADIDLGIVNILVGFAPLKPAEFVMIQIQQMAGQTAS